MRFKYNQKLSDVIYGRFLIETCSSSNKCLSKKWMLIYRPLEFVRDSADLGTDSGKLVLEVMRSEAAILNP